MAKKIFSLLLITAMLLSMTLLSSCKDERKPEESTEETVVLTPKEKFLKTGPKASTYFNGLASSLGIDTSLTPVTDGKMESRSLCLKLNKCSAIDDPYITEPFSISEEEISDIKNKASKILCHFEMGGENVPVEAIVTAGAMYIGIDKVTDRMIKIPVEKAESSESEENTISQVISADDYLSCFMSSFSDDLFTALTGKATVDGTEIADAETVTLNATRKQFDEALLKVLEKAKTDSRITSFLTGAGITDKKDTTYQDAITVFKDSIIEDIKNCSDNDKITITVISEKNVLRSIVLTGNDNENKYSVSFTTTLKNGTQYIKGVVMCNEKKAVDLSYQQKPNDKGSADGELMISVDPKAFERDESEESGDAVSEDFQPYFESGSYSLSIKFSGEKKDNKVSVNTKLEISTDQSGLKITATINIAFLYEKVSDTENKFSVNISTNVMDTVVDLTFSGGKKIVDYTAIKVPADSEVDDISKVNSDDLIKKLTEKYPGIEKYTPSFKFSSQSTKYEETEFEVYNTEDSSFSIILYKNGRGYLSSELKDLKYENGKYSVKLPDESTISGTYTQNGNNFIIDGKTGFVMKNDDGCKTISKTVNDEHVSINIDSANNEIRIDSNFTYTLDGETLKLELATGGEKILKFVKNGDSCTINGVKVKLEK